MVNWPGRGYTNCSGYLGYLQQQCSHAYLSGPWLNPSFKNNKKKTTFIFFSVQVGRQWWTIQGMRQEGQTIGKRRAPGWSTRSASVRTWVHSPRTTEKQVGWLTSVILGRETPQKLESQLAWHRQGRTTKETLAQTAWVVNPNPTLSFDCHIWVCMCPYHPYTHTHSHPIPARFPLVMVSFNERKTEKVPGKWA